VLIAAFGILLKINKVAFYINDMDNFESGGLIHRGEFCAKQPVSQ
jgi:hypothetical protein